MDQDLLPAALPDNAKNRTVARLYELTIITLGAFPLLALLAAILLSFRGEALPEAVWPLVGTSLASLGGVLYGKAQGQ